MSLSALQECLYYTQQADLATRQRAETMVLQLLASSASMSIFPDFIRDVSQPPHLRQLAFLLLGQYIKQRGHHYTATDHMALSSLCFDCLGNTVPAVRNGAMTLLSKLCSLCSPGVRNHNYAALATTTIAALTALANGSTGLSSEQSQGAALTLLRAAFVIVEDADADQISAFIPGMLPICVNILSGCPKNYIQMLRYAARIMRVSAASLSSARMTGGFDATEAQDVISTFVSSWTENSISWIARCSSVSDIVEAAGVVIELSASLVVLVDAFPEFCSEQIPVMVSCSLTLLNVLREPHAAEMASKSIGSDESTGYSTDGDRIDVEILVSNFLQLLSIGLSDEDEKMAMKDGQVVGNILGLLTDFAQLTPEQREVFFEDGNEFMSKELDEFSDHNIRYTGKEMVQQMCKLPAHVGISCVFGAVAVRLMQLESSFGELLQSDSELGLISSSFTQVCLLTFNPERAKSKDCKSSGISQYTNLVLQAESLLWQLEVVAAVYNKHARLIKAAGIDINDPHSIASALAAFRSEREVVWINQYDDEITLSKRHRAALGVLQAVTVSQVKGFMLRMLQIFASLQLADVVRGRMMLAFVAVECIFDADELKQFFQAGLSLVTLNHVSLASRLQVLVAIGRVLSSRNNQLLELANGSTDRISLPTRSLGALCGIDLVSSRTLLSIVLQCCMESTSVVTNNLFELLTLLLRHDGAALISDAEVLNALVNSCLMCWQKCSFDSLCIDAIAVTLRMIAKHSRGRVVVDKFLHFARSVFQLTLTSSVSASSSVGGENVVSIPSTSIEVMIELMGKLVARAVIDNVPTQSGITSQPEDVEFGATAFSECFRDLVNIYLRNQTRGSFARPALQSINMLLSTPQSSTLLAAAAAVLGDTVTALLRSILGYLSMLQQSSESHDFESIVEVAGPAFGLLGHLLMQHRVLTIPDAKVVEILMVIVCCSLVEDSEYLRLNAMMIIVHLIARDVRYFSTCLAQVSLPTTAGQGSTSPLAHLLEQWTNAHFLLSSRYNRKISFLGLLAMMQLFAQSEANHGFAQRVLQILVKSMKEDLAQVGRGDEEDDVSQEDEVSVARSTWEAGECDNLGDDDEYIEDDEESDVNDADGDDDPFAPADLFDTDASDPFTAYLSTTTNSKQRSGDAELSGMVHVGSQLMYRPSNLDPLSSVESKAQFRDVILGLLVNASVPIWVTSALSREDLRFLEDLLR